MTPVRVRMLGGPNGSGKSTLLKELVDRQLPLGRVLDPDAIEGIAASAGYYDGPSLGIVFDQSAVHAFMRRHGLYDRLPSDLPAVQPDRIEFPTRFFGTTFNAIICDFIRTQWLDARESFTFETVMSHEGKVDFLREAGTAGCRTYLYFICTDSPEINVGRVANRVVLKGHSVPESTIRQRYERTLSFLKDAILAANRAYLFDNSTLGGHRWIAEFENGTLTQATEEQPNWSLKHAIEKLA